MKTHYENWPEILDEWVSLDVVTKTLTDNVFIITQDDFRDFVSIFRILMRFAWWCLRWSFLVFLAVWALMQSLVIEYTVISTVFLDFFYQQKLSIVRNWICSSWNKLRHNRDDTYSSTNLNESFEVILQSNEKIMFYKLSYHISSYQTIVRSYRASLLKFEYDIDDQNYFRFKFTTFIDQSNDIIFRAQIFHAHIVRIINTHISNTKYVMQRLKHEEFLSFSSISVAQDDILTRSITWLNFYYLIYLSAGIESFQETSLQRYNSRNVKLMKNYVALIDDRLWDDIQIILRLQSSLWALR